MSIAIFCLYGSCRSKLCLSKCLKNHFNQLNHHINDWYSCSYLNSHIFIPSHAGLLNITMATMYPILIRVVYQNYFSTCCYCNLVNLLISTVVVMFISAAKIARDPNYFISHQLPTTIPISLLAVKSSIF